MPPGWEPGPSGWAWPVVLVSPRSTEDLVRAHEVAADRPVVVVSPNLARPSLVLALLTGHGDEEVAAEDRAGPTRAALDDAAAELGREPASEPALMPATTGRPLWDLLAGVAAETGGHDRPWIVRSYRRVPEPCATAPLRRPFLSVLVRTQGRRPEALAEVLICLAAQTSSDFEVVLLPHDMGSSERKRLDRQLASLPRTFRVRLRVVPVTGGGRSRPLNVGLAAAVGRYVCVLDDDDIVLAHWVEAFATGSVRAPGLIQRAMAVEQDVEAVKGVPGYRAASVVRPRWEREFSLLSHLVDNHSPIHSYALPREVFTDLGLRFDESLPVLEDWDLLVRSASLVGVHDTEEVTAVYRRWPASASSFAHLPEGDWPATAWRVVDAWDRRPLLLPAGSARRLRREGIATLRRRPLGVQIRGRLQRERDRWAPRLVRWPVFPLLRWCYRRMLGRDRQLSP